MIIRSLLQASATLFLISGGMFVPGELSAAMYSVRDLGPLSQLPGRSDGRPNAVSLNGNIAGANVVGSAYHALRYNGAWNDLGTLGGSEALAVGINDLNQVVGCSTTGAGVKHAFLWTAGATGGVSGNPQMKDLLTLGGNQSEAYDINNAGQVSGYSQTATRDHAFLYSGGTMLDIGALLAGSKHSYGYGINDAGHVAGTAYNNSYSTSAAFFYNGSTAVEIATGGGNSSALAINNSDHIVGYAAVDGFDHAFHYANGTVIDLKTLGGNYSYAIGINNSNVIVGGSFIDPNDSVYHAFVCISNVLIDLNGQLDATGAGWTLTEARAINDAGQIVGVGRFGGTDRGFILDPIMVAAQPSTITDLRTDGAGVLISFTTVTAARYAVESRANLADGAWTEVIGNLSGTGAVMTITNVGGLGSPARFYRVKSFIP
jgi:probable HAF family extracellular repeat protein